MKPTGTFSAAFVVFMFTGGAVFVVWVALFSARGIEDDDTFFLLLAGVPGIVAFLSYRFPAPFAKAFDRILPRL